MKIKKTLDTIQINQKNLEKRKCMKYENNER